jgi:hypothetical protein
MADAQDPKVEQLEEDSDDEVPQTTNNASAEDALEEVSGNSLVCIVAALLFPLSHSLHSVALILKPYTHHPKLLLYPF